MGERPRYKVWTVGLDGEPGTLLLRTGSSERSDRDVDFAGTEPGDVAMAAYIRTGVAGRMLVKNFDTGLWYTADVDSSTARVIITEGKP